MNDVAFSLLSADEPAARAICDALPPEIDAFLYSIRQKDILVERDGLEVFSSTFRQARKCVLLLREGWGDSGWTRVEKDVIRDRCLLEGAGFLVLVRMDLEAQLPSWVPRSDLWIDFQSEGAMNTAKYIAARLQQGVPAEGALVTAHSFARRPIPIARYQAQRLKIMGQSSPNWPEVCDACTSAVVFRPLIQMTLPQERGLPSVQEQLCPLCARDRGITTSIPDGMTEAEVYSGQNPSFSQYLFRVLRWPILETLSDDEDLARLGVSNVGASLAGNSGTILVFGRWQEPLEIKFSAFSIEKLKIRDQTELTEYFKTLIQGRLSGFGSSAT